MPIKYINIIDLYMVFNYNIINKTTNNIILLAIVKYIINKIRYNINDDNIIKY